MPYLIALSNGAVDIRLLHSGRKLTLRRHDGARACGWEIVAVAGAMLPSHLHWLFRTHFIPIFHRQITIILKSTNHQAYAWVNCTPQPPLAQRKLRNVSRSRKGKCSGWHTDRCTHGMQGAHGVIGARMQCRGRIGRMQGSGRMGRTQCKGRMGLVGCVECMAKVKCMALLGLMGCMA
eukprot:238048-Chlamydomonas_euryale.AAC.1